MKEIRLKDCNKILSCGVAATPDYIDNGIPFISAQNIQNGNLDFSTLKYITKEAHLKLTKNKKVKYGDVLITRIGSKVGESCIFNLNNEVSIYVSLTHLRLKKEVNNKFFTYLIKTHKFYEFVNENTISCGGVGNLNVSLLKNFTFSLPPLSQQTAIANYLDYNTEKIDKEISLLEQKVEKLDEYKQALIYETVTKGLDKNITMKDSGIEWIGMIPEHWKVKRVKDFAYCYAGGTPETNKNEYWENGTNYWAASGNLKNGLINLSVLKKITDLAVKNSSTKKIKPFTTLIAMTGATCGEVGYSNIPIYANQSVCAIKNKNNSHYKFLFYFLLSTRKHVESLKLGGAQAGINGDDIKHIKILFPNIIEQQEISNYLDTECLQINNKKELIKKKIELLKEYKESLIYESVTGKLTVGEEYGGL